MKKQTNTRAGLKLFVLITILFVLAEPASLIAQRRRPIPPPANPNTEVRPPAAPPPDVRTFEQAQMEMNILLSRRSAEAEIQRARNQAAAQLSRDLQKLDQINTDKIIPLSKADAVDHKDLAQATAEIRDRATRIKFNAPLVLKDTSGQKVRFDQDASQLPTMLPHLSRLIKSFLENPVLRVSSANDAQLRSTAGHDLESIIKLSDTIHKIAKKLSKSGIPA